MSISEKMPFRLKIFRSGKKTIYYECNIPYHVLSLSKYLSGTKENEFYILKHHLYLFIFLDYFFPFDDKHGYGFDTFIDNDLSWKCLEF